LKYKVIKIYIVEAANKKAAIEEVNKNPDTLETTIVKEVVQEGWGGTLKKQLGF
jgi:hypothetical protein